MPSFITRLFRPSSIISLIITMAGKQEGNGRPYRHAANSFFFWQLWLSKITPELAYMVNGLDLQYCPYTNINVTLSHIFPEQSLAKCLVSVWIFEYIGTTKGTKICRIAEQNILVNEIVYLILIAITGQFTIDKCPTQLASRARY